MRFNRRQFLSAMGLGAAGIAATGRRALGSNEVPKRLIILSTSHGTVYDGWKMRPRGRTGDQAWTEDLTGLSSTDFSRALEPLFPHRGRLQVLDGWLLPLQLELPAASSGVQPVGRPAVRRPASVRELVRGKHVRDEHHGTCHVWSTRSDSSCGQGLHPV